MPLRQVNISLRDHARAHRETGIWALTRLSNIFRPLNIISRYLAFVVFVLAPLPFGSVDLRWICVWIVLLALSLLIADVSKLTHKHFRLLLPLFGTITLVAAVAALQMWPAPASGQVSSVWQALRDFPGVGVSDRISVTAGAPWLAIGYPILFVMALTRAFLLAADAQTARQLIKILGRAGLCYALFGVLAQISDPAALLLRQKEAYLGFATGTFVNRNTAATFWGSSALLFLLPLLHIFFRGPLREGPSFSIRVLEKLDRSLSSPIFLVVGFLICTTAASMTGSRAGLLLSVFAFLLASALYLAPLPLERDRWWGWLAGAVAAVGALLQLAGGLVFGRITSSGLIDQSRLDAYRSAFTIIREHPLFGIGLGNFETAFPAYRLPELGSQGIWDRAHSTPIEMAVDLGLPTTALIGLCATFYFYHLFRGSLRRKQDRYIPVLGAAVGSLGILHSCIDFSLQIPGYGIFWAAIVGCGLAQCLSSRQKDLSSRQKDLAIF